MQRNRNYCQIWKKIEFYRQILQIIQIPNFMKIYSGIASSSMPIHSNRYRWTDWDLTKRAVVVFNMAARLKLLMKKRRWMQVAVGSYVILLLVQNIGDRHISDEFTDTSKLWIKWIEETFVKLHSLKKIK